MCEKFIEDLLEVYEKKCSEISEDLENTKDSEKIEGIKKYAKQVLISLKFMPDEIKDEFEPKINEFFEIHDKTL